MSDATYKKQLEAFGIEAVRITDIDLEKKRQEETRQAMLSVVKALMDRTEGRQWIYSKLDMCKVFTTPFVPGQPDGTAFFSGVQSVGQNLLSDVMEASPENFYTMIQEENARKASV